LLPGYRLIKNEQHRTEVEDFWGLERGKISPIPGLTAWDMITGLESDHVKLLCMDCSN
jgi:ferredoxin-nitrate reductase